MPVPKILGSKTTLYLMKGLGILGAVACGLFTTYKLMWEPENIRWVIVYFYLSFFSLLIISAELGLLNHRQFRKFGMFLTTFTGRAFFYIFIGGLLLHGYGWIPGIYMLALGLLNLAAQCMCPSDLAAKPSSTATVAAATPAPI